MATLDFTSLAASLGDALQELFGGDAPQQPLALYQVAARAVLIYAVGVTIVRVGKSRLVSRMTSLDVILGFILGSLLSRGITGQASLSGTAAASIALVACHWLFTRITYQSHMLGTLLKGRAVVLVKDGVPDRKRMRHSHISDHDLEEELRLAGVGDLDQVHLAHKERNGEISVLKKPREAQVVDVRVESGVQTVRIVLAE